MNLNEIRDLDGRVENAEMDLEGPKADLKHVVESGCDALRIRKDAFKSARKLKRMKPVDQSAWLRTFDACRLAFGLDDQLELEDAIAGANDDHAVTITGAGIEVPIKTSTRAIRRAARELAN